MDSILWLLLAAFAGCVLLGVGVVAMFFVEQVAGLFGWTLFGQEGEFEDD